MEARLDSCLHHRFTSGLMIHLALTLWDVVPTLNFPVSPHRLQAHGPEGSPVSHCFTEVEMEFLPNEETHPGPQHQRPNTDAEYPAGESVWFEPPVRSSLKLLGFIFIS